MVISEHPVLVVMAAAAAAPFLAEIPIGIRVPVIVVEVLLGILIGPHVLGFVQPDGPTSTTALGGFMSTMQLIGTSAVLFMAGMEIDFGKARGRPLKLALSGWLLSVGLAFLAVGLLHAIPGVNAPMMVTIALTTTGLGALLPILRDSGQLATPYGIHLQAAGAIGEVGPIVATSLLLSSRYSTLQELGFLLALIVLVGLAATAGMRARPPRLIALLGRTMQASTQLPVRLALLVVAGFMVVAVEFGFEGIFGAFVAGMVVGLATRGEEGRPFRAKVDAVFFAWFVPFFFIGTGLQFDLGALTSSATTMFLIPAFLVLFLLVRGVTVCFYRKELSHPQRLSFALSSSVASLSLVVVITQIGLRVGSMNPDVAQALIGAALLSLLLFPTLANVRFSKVAAPELWGQRKGTE